MVKYFCSSTDIRSAWDHVVSAFWQRYPNPFSTHVLTEDVVYRETNRLPRWGERFFPSGMARSVYIIEDSIGTPGNTLNHNSAEQPGTTLLKREAWISSGIYGFSKPIQVHTAATQSSEQRESACRCQNKEGGRRNEIKPINMST
uniref:PRELI/MSF1 domain-containing protein n=1 Tax=Salarias fasciatus TaxID=181472 RepID=A0A672H344_SALFA